MVYRHISSVRQVAPPEKLQAEDRGGGLDVEAEAPLEGPPAGESPSL